MSKAAKISPFLSLCNSVEAIATRLLDGAAFNGARLGKIEDRLAALDAGPDAAAAARQAYDDVNAARRREGRPVLKLKRP
jgi:hypothetical protein